jgi:hypothetical protein
MEHQRHGIILYLFNLSKKEQVSLQYDLNPEK